MEEVKRALFVPKNTYGGYNCSVEISKEAGQCVIKLLAGPGKEGLGDESALMDLMDVVDRGRKKFFVGDVYVKCAPFGMTRDYKPLSFEEAVGFMSKFDTFKRV